MIKRKERSLLCNGSLLLIFSADMENSQLGGNTDRSFVYGFLQTRDEMADVQGESSSIVGLTSPWQTPHLGLSI